MKDIIKQDYVAGYVELEVSILEHPNEVEIPIDIHIITAAYSDKVRKGDIFNAVGAWKTSSMFGYQFETENMFLAVPESLEEIESFLIKNIKNIEENTVNKLLDYFGFELINIIRDNPKELFQVEGISRKQVQNLTKRLPLVLGFEEDKLKLALLGFEKNEIEELIKKWGFSTVNLIENNPYIASNKRLVRFRSCDIAASKLGIDKNSQQRIRAGILGVLSKESRNGHMFVSKNDIIIKLNGILNYKSPYKEKTIIDIDNDFNPAIDYLITVGEIKIEIDDINLDDNVYVRFYYDIENKIVGHLKEILSQNQGIMTEIEALGFIKKAKLDGTEVGEEQEQALIMALTNRVSIISGRPGSGKTYTADLVIRAIKTYNSKSTIALAAPSGKAAKRITEMTGMEAKTIHRLIGLTKDGGDKKRLIDIKSDYLIIDESSMVDAYVFERLLSCITKKTKLLIIGDVDQIPSVQPGMILRDLIDSKVIATTMLTKIYRQAQFSQIIQNAHNIIDGVSELYEDDGKGDFYFIDEDDEDVIKGMTTKSIDRLLETGWDLSDIQILTTTKKDDLGAEEFNNLIQETYNPKEKGKKEIIVGNGRVFRINDRIMQMENDYDLGIFNGEMGNIVDIKTGKIDEIEVNFGDKTIIYTSKTLVKTRLAYAITSHKSQGSEFKLVIMPIHELQRFTLNKSIIYTSLTRAKERMIFIGQKDEYFMGIKNDKNTIRNSRVKEKLMLLNDSGSESSREQLDISRTETVASNF